MLQFRQRKYLFVLLVIIIASPFVFYIVTKLFQVPSLCGGQPREVNWESGHLFQGRSVRTTEAVGDQLWLSFGDGGFGVVFTREGKYYAEECTSGPAQHNLKPGNDILVLESGVYFATDETSTWLYSGGTMTDIGNGISTTATYGLYFDEVESAIYMATINGIYRLVDGLWVRQDFLSAPLTSDRFHALTHVGNEWILGSNELAGVLVYNETDGTWMRYNQEGVYRTVNGEWTLVSDTVRYPNKVRSMATVVIENSIRVYIAADSDTEGQGLMVYENGQLSFVSGLNLYHLVRVNHIEGRLVVSDYLGGASVQGQTEWVNVGEFPTFDATFFNGKLVLATSDGLQTFDMPN